MDTARERPIARDQQPHLEPLLPERDAARLLSVSIAWLRRGRWAGYGPRFVKVGGPSGRAVRYALSDLYSYIEANRNDPNSTS